MKTILENIIKNTPNKLTSEILTIVLQNDNPKNTIENLIDKWSKYSTVEKFNDENYINYLFDNYYNEIEYFRNIAIKSDDFCEGLDLWDIKKYFVNLAIDCIIKDIYDDIFISKLKTIAIKEPNTLTSHILSNIICSEHPQDTFEKLLDDKCYQWALAKYNDKAFYHNLFDKYYAEINDTVNDLVHCWSDIEISHMSDIKTDLVCIVVDYIITTIDDELVY